MDLTQGTEKEKIKRSKKMMLWFAIVSMAMMFAGLTSAYVVSESRVDWLDDFELPKVFIISTLVVMFSSLTYYMAKRAVFQGDKKRSFVLLFATLLLGITFIVLQLEGFKQIVEKGYYFTGSESSITTSFVYLIIVVHIAHVLAGLMSIIVVIYNHYKQRYNEGQMLGIELSATFWHFVDILWVYLFLFLYFFR